MGNRTFRVELANGHRPLGFVAGRKSLPALGAGDKVRLVLSPYDLSQGRILVGQVPSPSPDE